MSAVSFIIGAVTFPVIAGIAVADPIDFFAVFTKEVGLAVALIVRCG
jgi:hypothetical protein